MEITKNSLGNIKTTDILPHHDVVFKAPVCDPFYGLPIGNGSTGCLLWLSPEALHININHTDLVDDIDEGDFYYKREDETHAVCRNGAELVLDFGCPVFDVLYKEEFESRISLADATAKINSKTPFCNVGIDAFASEKSNVAIVSLDSASVEDMLLRASIKRWGSRTMMYWYLRVATDAGIGLSGTEAKTAKNCLLISQELGKQFFSIALLPVTDSLMRQNVIGSHKAEIEFESNKSHKIDFYIAVGFGKTREDAEKDAFSYVANASEIGKDAVFNEHKNDWADFWNKSYIALDKKDDFIENLWYLNLYYGNSEMKGKYPPHFCNGIWGNYHDFVPWNMYFHYNTQHAFNSYNAANHPELMETYFNFRSGQLDKAKHYAKEIKGTNGAFITDISDLLGRLIVDDKELSKNCTCGAQIAMLMYKHYLYTSDENFFTEKALPFMKEIGLFYLDMLKLESDGLYHISDTTAYEGSPPFDDSFTDLVTIRSLFGALIDVLPEEESAIYKDRLEKLVGFTATDMDEDETKDGKFVFGIGKGKEPHGTKVLSVGTLAKGSDTKVRTNADAFGLPSDIDTDTPIRKTFGTAEKNANSYYGFPDIEMSPVFPAGIVGIKDKGTDLYDMIYKSICMNHPAFMDKPDEKDLLGLCMGWCMMPIYLARMGMADELREQLHRTASTWIAYPQGFGIYGPYAFGSDSHPGTHDTALKSEVLLMEGKHRDKVVNYVVDFDRAFFNDKPEYFSSVPLWNFRHFNYETMPIISSAVNEMLIQSYDGNLRLFGALKKDAEVSFKLAAQGGFIVSAIYKNGEFDVLIESTRDGELRIIFDNANGDVRFTDATTNRDLSFREDNRIYVLNTQKGEKIFASTCHSEDFTLNYDNSPNNNVKVEGSAKLGNARQF